MKILAVDDNPEILMLISVALEALGHQVLVASDPPMALDLLTIAEIDAIVLDVKMPHMTGYDLLEILRADPRIRHLPVLLLSSLGDTIEERIRGIRLGANDFLRKPFDPEEVLVRLERMMTMRAVPEGGIAGDLARSGLVEILQRLEQEQRSGVIRVDGVERHGRIVVERGLLGGASYGLLEGVEAVLGMLSLNEGFFSFEPAAGSLEVGDIEDRFALPTLMLKLAWLQDELERKEGWLPAEGAPLEVRRALGDDLRSRASVPYLDVYERVQVLPGITVRELLALEIASPLKVQLATAVLHEIGVLALRDATSDGAADEVPWSDAPATPAP